MCKFSVIVPIYNVEKYLKRCLDSLVNQTFKDYEVILVNDGSPDNSQSIIDDYTKKYSFIKGYKKENGGLSDARNYGIDKSVGEYLIFVDSDDYVEIDMLEILNNKLAEQKYDLIKFNYDEFNENNEFTNNSCELEFTDNGFNTFKKLCFNKKSFEMAWLYAYNKEFFINNKFKFAKGRVHEDFGLTPIVLLKAHNILVIKDSLYHYFVSSYSITRNNDYDKTLKMAYDYLYHYDNLKSNVENIEIDIETKKIFLSYISNAIIEKSRTLNKNDFKIYVKELKKRKIFDNILSDTFKQKLKKLFIKTNISLYFKIFR